MTGSSRLQRNVALGLAVTMLVTLACFATYWRSGLSAEPVRGHIVPLQESLALEAPEHAGRDEASIKAPIDALKRVSQDSLAAQVQREDRVAEAVHVMPGGREVEGTLFMDQAVLRAFFTCKDDKSVLCRVPERFRQCLWCARESCITGTLYASGVAARQPHTERQRQRLQGAARAFTWREPVDATRPVTDVLMFSCRLKGQVPMQVVGSLTLRLPVYQNDVGEVVVSRRLARMPTVVPPGSVATCGRATYGDVNANHIVQMSEYLRFHGFQSLYVYNAGSTTMHDPMKLEMYLARLAKDNSTALRYLDMRNHLDTLFGSSADFAFMSSHAGGQEWTKYDCALRARRDGHDWILHTDLDEFIFPGQAMIEEDLMKPMAERLKALVKKGYVGFSVGAVIATCDEDVHPYSEWPLDPAKSRARWESFMERVGQHYLTVVLADPLSHFSTNGACGDDFRMCHGESGSRKLFLKSSFPPIKLRVHATNTDTKVWTLDATTLHSRHYPCMNAVDEPKRLLTYPDPVPPTAKRPCFSKTGC